MKTKPHDLSGEELLEAVEKGHDDHPLVADLMGTSPPANQHFKQQLEDNLVRQLNKPSKSPLQIATRRHVPLTLIASLLIVFAFGMVMLGMNATSDSTPLQASDDSVPVVTATPVFPRPTEASVGVISRALENFVPVVVASRDIPTNTQITSDDVMVVYMPREQIETRTRNRFFNTLEDVLNIELYANQRIPQFSPLRGAMLDDTPLLTYGEDGQPQLRIPQGYLGVLMPVDSATMEQLQPFDHITVVIGFNFADIDEAFQQIEPDVDAEFRMQILVESAMVLYVDEIKSPEASQDEVANVITLLVSSEQARTLLWALEANLPYVIVPLN